VDEQRVEAAREFAPSKQVEVPVIFSFCYIVDNTLAVINTFVPFTRAPEFVARAMAEGCSVSNIVNGFAACGIFPFEPNWVSMNMGKLGTSKNTFKVSSSSQVTQAELDKAIEIMDEAPYSWVHEVDYLDLAVDSHRQRLKFGAWPDPYGFLKVCSTLKLVLLILTVRRHYLITYLIFIQRAAAVHEHQYYPTNVKKETGKLVNGIGESHAAPKLLTGQDRIVLLLGEQEAKAAEERRR
jgi:hypothetical protein